MADNFGATLRLIVVVQGLLVVVGVPFLGWLFSTLLDLVGERSVTTIDAADVFLNPPAFAVLVLVLMVGGALLFADLLIFLVAARSGPDGDMNRVRVAIRRFRPVLRNLAHPSSLLLIPYFALIVPLSGFALGGLFTGGVRVPAPLGGSILEGFPGGILYFCVALGVTYAGVRLIMTLPLLASGGTTVASAMRASWRLTRGRLVAILTTVGSVAACGAIVVAGIASVGLVPTRYADAEFPAWSPIIAAASLSVIEIAGFLTIGLCVALLSSIAREAVSGGSRTHLRARGDGQPDSRRGWRWVRIAAVVATISGLTAYNFNVIDLVSDGENTVLVSHRGVVAEAVENTIPALEAAAAAGPDFVEIDVQETRDGDFAVFHDATLLRLAGDPREIGSMTMSELRAIGLRQNGIQGRISSLDDVIVRARQLDQPLLIELKPRGDETRDYLANFDQILREHDVLDTYMVASFDKAVIEEFAAMEPAVPTGYIIRFNLGRAPDTTADFLVINSGAYSPALRDDAWSRGLELFVWTVDDMPTVRDLLRDSVDGIITNRTNAAQAERQQVRFETGVVSRLEDLIRRTFGV